VVSLVLSVKFSVSTSVSLLPSEWKPHWLETRDLVRIGFFLRGDKESSSSFNYYLYTFGIPAVSVWFLDFKTR
jgi:hypothetical protein